MTDEISFDDEEIGAASHWHGGQGSMLYAIVSTGSLRRGTIRPRHDEGRPMTDEEWMIDLAERLESEAENSARDAAKQAKRAKGAEKKELLADREGLRSIAFKASQFGRSAQRAKAKSSHATRSRTGLPSSLTARTKSRHHAMKKKSPAQLKRDIDEALTKKFATKKVAGFARGPGHKPGYQIVSVPILKGPRGIGPSGLDSSRARNESVVFATRGEAETYLPAVVRIVAELGRVAKIVPVW